MPTSETEKKEEKELPQMYHLAINKAQLEYLTIGLIANAAAINLAHGQFDDADQVQKEWRRSILSWIVVNTPAVDVGKEANDLTTKAAMLLGATLCPFCNDFHLEGGHG